ncbi:hypothetical protein M378DRAFT_14252 [Amanita muscaria Koide BX008]|uniref:Uncharacterized protein n=1 Tax=Amanita muscaria (strain Koide BX008) TaxID=946122 RepID=A0A0C2SBP1_AMAMK|nr:hypothetical protein M378DRAFT_14252 [Amanita muscaria Koide BX008]
MPYYGPNEDSDTIFFERTFLAGMFVVGVGYGMQLILYVVCARYLWRERDRRGRGVFFLLAYITLLLGLSSLWASSVTWAVENIYIDNRNYPGGPWSYVLATPNLPEDVILITGVFVLTFLSDLLMIWRCWVIWTSSSRALAFVVVAFPSLTLLASIATGIVWIQQSALPGPALFNKMALAFGTSYYVTSLGVNIAVTILITLRLALHRRVLLESLPPDHATHYLSIVAIVVESAALYSVIALTFIISYALNSPINQIFLGILPASQQIAGYLIILRLAQGRAWSADTLTETTGATPQLTTIQFDDPIPNVQVDSDLRPNRSSLKPEP